MINIVGPTLLGYMLAPLIALAVGMYVAHRYGGDSEPRRQAIAVGTILLAVVLAAVWGVIGSRTG